MCVRVSASQCIVETQCVCVWGVRVSCVCVCVCVCVHGVLTRARGRRA